MYHGRRLLSGVDPVREADRTAERRVNTSSVYVLLGWGLGYLQMAVRRRRPAAHVMVFEPDIDLVSLVLSRVDLSAAGSLELYCDEESLLRRLETMDLAGGRGYREIGVTAMVRRDPDRFAKLEHSLLRVFSRKASSHMTRQVLGRRWFFNTLANLRLTDRCVDPEVFRQTWRADSVVLIGAGPALSRRLELLSRLRGKYPLIAVDSAVHVLSRAGIDVDIVVVMDSQYFNVCHLKFADLRRSLLALDLSAVKTVDRLLSASQRVLFTRVVTVDETGETDVVPFAGYVCRQLGVPAMTVQSGGSVSTSAFDICRQLGVKRIYTIGMGLAYEDILSHSRGSAYERFHLERAGRTSGLADRFYRFLRQRQVEPTAAGESRDFTLQMYADWFAEATERSGIIMREIDTDPGEPIDLKEGELQGIDVPSVGADPKPYYARLERDIKNIIEKKEKTELEGFLSRFLPPEGRDRCRLLKRIIHRCKQYGA